MVRLILLRHAKSDWEVGGLRDFDRPLSNRGNRAAPLVGRTLTDNALDPDRILCSTARRTRETLAHILPLLYGEANIGLLNALYDGSEQDYVGLIRDYGGTASTLMVIGHNPATEETALCLAETRTGPIAADMIAKFPTAAYAVFEFSIENWADIAPGSGRLTAFVKPRDLASP